MLLILFVMAQAPAAGGFMVHSKPLLIKRHGGDELWLWENSWLLFIAVVFLVGSWRTQRQPSLESSRVDFLREPP